MQSAVRQHLRQAINTYHRTQRQTLIDTGELQVCPGCQGDLADYTPKCARCYDRKRRGKVPE